MLLAATSSIHTHLFVVWKLLLPHTRRRVDTVQLNFHANTRTSGNGNRAVRTQFERWFGEVGEEIAIRRRDVARQRNAGKRRKSEIRRSPNAGFHHPADP